MDAASAGKYYHFIRLMGRAASHVTLEVALAVRPNVALISEDVKARGQTLAGVVDEISDVVLARRAAGVHHGVVVLPEGLVENLADVGALVAELNELEAAGGGGGAGGGKPDEAAVEAALSPASASLWRLLPPTLRGELLLDRDPHGNVQVSRIETERLLAGLVSARVAANDGGRGVPICTHFFGYEGRCALPSNFDVAYTAALGAGAAALVAAKRTGLIVSVTDIEKRAAEWGVGGHPIAALMTRERRRGKDKVVVRKALVELDGAPFRALAAARGAWALEDAYACPGPIQFSGVAARAATRSLSLAINGGEPIVTH